MAVARIHLLLVLLLIVGVGSNCPTWTRNSSGVCVCGPDFNHRLVCSNCNLTVDINAGYCMTFDKEGYHTRENTSRHLVGGCPYSPVSELAVNRRYSRLPTNPIAVNRSLCEPYRHEGLFCWQCQKGFGPAAYSFDLHRANCSLMTTTAAVTFYVAVELLPITVFYFVIFVFRFPLMTGTKLGYMVFCQSVINTVQYSRYIYTSLFYQISWPVSVLGHLSFTLSGIGNLKFFRFISPRFCISEHMTGIQMRVLELITALYDPLFLVLVT